MPAVHRNKTKYIGVYFIIGKVAGKNKSEPIYYIRYRKDGKLIEEKVGCKSINDMTPSRANNIRSERIQGRQLSNNEMRKAEEDRKKSEKNRWTIDRIWEEYKARNPDVKGLVIDENRYCNYIKEPFGNKELKDILSTDIDKVKKDFSKIKSNATIRNFLELFRRISNFAVKKKICQGLDFTIEMPNVNNKKTEFLTDDELSRLWNSITQENNIQVANLMKLALFTGMRRGELFKLKWDDIDFYRGFIFIRDPKGGENAEIPINDAARNILENHPRTSSEYVFPGKHGHQRTDVNHQVNRIKKRAGLPRNFRPLHGLRHTFASLLASSGEVDIYVLQKLMTHKSLDMTQRYAHLRDAALRRASCLAVDIIEDSIHTNDSRISSSQNM